jgi:hypothetical protein
MLYYRIAGLRVAIEELPGIPKMINFEPFACEAGAPDILYHVKAYAAANPPAPLESQMELVSEDVVNRLYLFGDRMYKRVAMQEGDPRAMWFEQVLGHWNEATVYIPEDWLDFIGFGNVLSFEKTLLPFGALMLHCALIEHEGRGIAFSAPSQTGKSTQANLWQQHKGARILNGDRAILRSEGGVIYAYGSPYAGSSDLFIDRKVPLAAIIMLEQAKQNTIRPIDQAEGLGLFLSQTALPIWEPTLFEMGMATLETILTTVPMGLLACLPHAGAVECAHQWIK